MSRPTSPRPGSGERGTEPGRRPGSLPRVYALGCRVGGDFRAVEAGSSARRSLRGRRAAIALLAVAVLACASGLARARGSRVSDDVALRQLVGQTIITGFGGTTPSADLLGRIRRGEIGGVILFGENIRSDAAAGELVRRLQREAVAAGNPPLLVAVDQEGGPVRRLRDGPPVASAAALGRTSNPAGVELQGRRTGAYLRRLGLTVDLAPVADVADERTSFLGSRVFGSDPRRVAALAAAFADGLQRSRVAATAKHFPGLGTAPANTDVARVVIRTPRAELERRLRPFREAVARGVRLVMVSNAAYPTLDRSGAPALFSKPIVAGLLRGRLGFGGVVITDALGAPAPKATRHAPARALAAGVDVLLYTGEAEGRAGFADLLASARANASVRAELATAGARIAALKTWLGRG